jgi:hypothetical protein
VITGAARFVRVTAIAGIVLVVAGLALAAVRHEASSPAMTTAEAGGLLYTYGASRPLDPHDPDDREILRGIPAAQRPLPRGEEWFGVFLAAYNPQRRALPTARRFVLVDTDGHRFAPEQRLGDNAYAYRPTDVGPGLRYPPDGSAAARNLTTEGALLLFRIPQASYEYGTLELRLTDPAATGPPASLRVS